MSIIDPDKSVRGSMAIPNSPSTLTQTASMKQFSIAPSEKQVSANFVSRIIARVKSCCARSDPSRQTSTNMVIRETQDGIEQYGNSTEEVQNKAKQQGVEFFTSLDANALLNKSAEWKLQTVINVHIAKIVANRLGCISHANLSAVDRKIKEFSQALLTQEQQQEVTKFVNEWRNAHKSQPVHSSKINPASPDVARASTELAYDAHILADVNKASDGGGSFLSNMVHQKSICCVQHNIVQIFLQVLHFNVLKIII